MTALATELDRFDVRVAARAPDLLREFNEVGVLTAADVHVALRLAELGGVRDETVTLAAEMHRGHYGLQALLYTAALHRYLCWRLPGYNPERNLAGVFYLFVRGMLGADTPVVDGEPCGVFAWRPSRELVEGLTDVLDGRGPA